MNNYPFVTIGVLNFNGLSFLKQTIPSILNLDYVNLEIIVFDNGSSDGSVDFLENNNKIKVIKSPNNIGYGAGKNAIVENARGEYVLLIDNDILFVYPTTIQQLIANYSFNNNTSFLSIPLVDKGQNKTEHYGLFYCSIKKVVEYDKINRMQLFSPGGFIGGIVFFRKTIFEKLGKYDTKYPFNLDDYDLSARSWLMGYSISVLPTVYAEHVGISTRINIDSFCWKNRYYFSGFSRMILKNYSTVNVFIWWPLSSLRIVFKALRKSVEFKSLKPICSLAISVFLFLRDLPETFNQRMIIQSNREVVEDVFLKIKPPKFN
jgi:GT2 family glycosyltransferase